MEDTNTMHDPVNPRILISEILNDDVLREIFDYVALLEPYERHRYSEILLHGLGWVRLGHVCRSWRRLLLAMPTLWGRIALVNVGAPSGAFGTLMRRSQKAALHAHCTGIFSYQTDGYEDKLKHYSTVVQTARHFVSRLESLKVLHIHLLNLFPFFQAGPLPALRNLHIWNPGSEPQVLDDDVVVDACNLVNASFELMGVGLPMATRLNKGLRLKLPNLRRFSVLWRSMWASDAQPATEQLRWIAATILDSPLITHLSIDIGLWHYDVDWCSLFNGKKASMRHLKSLSLTQRSMCLHSGDLLAHIEEVPPAFTFTARYLERSDVMPLVQALEPYLRSAASYSTMYIRFPHPMWVMVHILPDPGEVSKLSQQKTFTRFPLEDNIAKLERQTTLSLYTYGHLILAEELLPDFAPRLHLSNLTHLHINGNVNPLHWWFTFQQLIAWRMKAVHTLIIDNLSWLAPKAGTMNALGIIGPHYVPPPTENQATLGLPLAALRTLIVTMWVTGTKTRKRMGSIYILCILKHRKEIGLPIHSLYLRGGWMTPELRPSKSRDISLDARILEWMAAFVTGEVFDERRVFTTS